MGDSEGDPHMSEGMKHQVELKIGFLNHDVDELLEKYLDLYDIVVLGDPPLDLPNDIIDAIMN